MAEWWNSLTYINQMFYGAAMFFSVFFVWQLIAALMGLSGEEGEVEGGGDDLGDDAAYDDFESGAETDVLETTVSFQILSIRSILTFFTLFTWGCALYLNRNTPTTVAMTYSVIWGLAGMFSIAFVFYGLRRLTESGTKDLSTSIGKAGSVYLDIPEGGTGEVRVTVSGVISYVKARASGGRELKAGIPVRVVRRLDKTTVEVKPIDQD